MELFELTCAVPANTAPEEIIDRIAMDSSATDREKFLVHYVEEALDAAAMKEDEIFEKDRENDKLRDEIRGFEREVEKLEGEKKGLMARVPNDAAVPSNTSLAEVIRAILMDQKATNREKLLVKYFESRGGSWGWHQNEGR